MFGSNPLPITSSLVSSSPTLPPPTSCALTFIFNCSLYVHGSGTTYWSKGNLSELASLKKSSSPSLSNNQLSITPQIRAGLHECVFRLFWDLGYLDFLQILFLKSQWFWVHVCNCTVISSKHCFTTYTHYFWLLQSLCPFFQDDLWALGWDIHIHIHVHVHVHIHIHIHIPSRAEHSYSIHIDQLFSVLITITEKSISDKK